MPKKTKTTKQPESNVTYRDAIPARPSTETWQPQKLSGEKREVTNTPPRYF